MGYSELGKTVATAVMLAMLAVALSTDLQRGKIYNWLTVPCAAVGLALGATGGLPAVGDRALGAAAVLAAVLLVSALAGLGGGDAKLLIAMGALKGLHFAVWAMLLTGVFGGLLAVVTMIRRRTAKQTALNLVANMLSNAGGLSRDLAAGSVGGKLPYSIAIALGCVTALVLGA